MSDIDLLRLLTFNAGLLEVRFFGLTLLRPTPHIRNRLKQMPNALRESGADIVMLQEVYLPAHRRRLEDELKQDYPYSAHAGTRTFLRLSNGLMALSRYPILQADYVRFEQNDKLERLLAHKGYLRLQVKVPHIGLIWLFNPHTTVGSSTHTESQEADEIRAAQLEQMRNDAMERGGGIIAGDFNAGPQASAINHQQMQDDGWVDCHQTGADDTSNDFTWDPANPLNHGGPHDDCPPQRCDHIMLPASWMPRWSVDKSEIMFTEAIVHSPKEKLVPLSDHFGVMSSFVVKREVN